MMRAITMFLTLCALACTQGYAQFNTIEARRPVYRVATVWGDATDSIPIKEIPQQCDTSYIGNAVENEMEEEQIGHNVDVSYPLRSITVTSPYGVRIDPVTGKKSTHNGIDLKADYEPVYAMLPGQVIKVGKDKSSGIYVTLRHGDFTVSYCHLSAVTVRKGDYVLAGSTIACSGNTGRSTGPHTHLTCRLRGKYINPIFLLDFVENNMK